METQSTKTQRRMTWTIGRKLAVGFGSLIVIMIVTSLVFFVMVG
jgi:hypothetical protein